MQNRIQRLRVEEERAQKNIEDIRKRAEEIVRAHRARFCSTSRASPVHTFPAPNPAPPHLPRPRAALPSRGQPFLIG